MKVRNAIVSDLKAIVAIYNASIPSKIVTADLKPITVESRLNWFEGRDPKTRPIWVIELDDNVVGWLSFQNFYGRPAYQQTAELSIYIAPNYHRRGLGKILLEKAISASPSLGINNLLGFVFAINKPSLNLFYQYQFEKWGYLPQVAEIEGCDRSLIILGRKIII
ncbi:MAG: GNAT family N-acetyltransferase [Prochloraceae cyanobacterium]|nr:GNAT family N-acetyltransferase [Prochloraceae cyanobacterium]